jgi:hypothetical protein
MNRLLLLLPLALAAAAASGQAVPNQAVQNQAIQDHDPNRFGDRFTVDPSDALFGTRVHRVSNHINVFTHRSPDGGDNLASETLTNYLEHGWVNSNEQQMNASSQQHWMFLNTDAQVGGLLDLQLRHYGKGDGVGINMDMVCTGVNRGSDEGCEPLRITVVPRSENAGFAIDTIATDPIGQTLLRGPRNENGAPIPLPGHTAIAASENALLINLNPAKTYTAGNVQSISTCPAAAGLLHEEPFVSRFVCLTGDGDAATHTGAEWDRRFGRSSVTRLAAAIPFSLDVPGQQDPSICHRPTGETGPPPPDQFSSGPIPCDLPVVSLDRLTPGTLIALSSSDDDFEMPVIQSVAPQPFAAALFGNSLGNEPQALRALQAVTSGGFNVWIDGQMRRVGGIELSHIASLAEAAQRIQIPGAQLRFNAGRKRFEVVSNTLGAASSVSFLGSPENGQDLSGLLGGLQNQGAGLRRGGAGTVRAWLSKSHIADSLVTSGGGVGYAVNFPADTMAPGGWPPSDVGGPDAPYRLAWPIIATLPGNILVTTQFPFNQAMELGTKAFAGNRMTTAPSFRPVIQAGRWTDVAQMNIGYGNLRMPDGTRPAGGLIQGPMPTFTFSGCRVAPSGHYRPTNGLGSFLPVIDSPGEGCPESPKVTFSGAWANPYEIHAAGWIRSVFDPEFERRYPRNPNSPFKQADFHQVVTPSTSNFYALDGSAPCSANAGFCKGDPVEQVYDQHQLQGSNISYFRPVYQIGSWGGVQTFAFRGHAGGDSLLMVSNQDPAANFFGTAASRYFPDGHGHGGVTPPTGLALTGAYNEAITLDQLPGQSVGEQGTLLSVHCGYRDPTAPCRNGAWWPYRLWASETTAGNMELDANPNTGVLTYQVHGSFKGEQGSFPGLHTALTGETQAQTIVLGGTAAGGSGGALYVLNGKDTKANVDQGLAGCVLFDDGAVKFNCGARVLVHAPAGWEFDHVITGMAPAAGDRSNAIPTTAWVAAELGHGGTASVKGKLGAAAGSGASGLTFDGRGDSFQASFTTGGAPSGGGAAVEITFTPAYPGVRTCLINGGNDAAMAAPVYAKGVSATGFSLWVPASTTLPKATALIYSIQCR